MDFVNETPHPAALFRSASGEDRMYNSLLVRQRYRLLDGRHLAPATDEERLEDLRREPEETEYGVLEPDTFFPRTGTDLIVLGKAISARGPVRAMYVRVEAGPYDQTLAVIGDRVWEKSFSRGLRAGSPRCFETMPVTYWQAYGGTTTTEYGDLSFYKNPVGKGYYLSEEDALEKPLPNLEDPSALIQSWKDQPDPVGLGPYPMAWGLRLMELVSYDEEDEQMMLHPERGMFDRAYPTLAGQALKAGQTVRITGMSTEGTVQFDLPACPFEVGVRLGRETYVLDLELEEVLIDLPAAQVDVAYRKLFDYRFVPHQLRKTTLRRKHAREA